MKKIALFFLFAALFAGVRAQTGVLLQQYNGTDWNNLYLCSPATACNYVGVSLPPRSMNYFRFLLSNMPVNYLIYASVGTTSSYDYMSLYEAATYAPNTTFYDSAWAGRTIPPAVNIIGPCDSDMYVTIRCDNTLVSAYPSFDIQAFSCSSSSTGSSTGSTTSSVTTGMSAPTQADLTSRSDVGKVIADALGFVILTLLALQFILF